VSRGLTPSQTVGPYFSIALNQLTRSDLATAGGEGERVTIQGRVLDGDGQPVSDALIEIWQANAHGKYGHPEDVQDKPLEKDFLGWGRVATNANGEYSFTTVKPGRVPGPGGTLQAPHINVAMFMRGLLLQLVTRIYFASENSNGEDPVLNLLDPERRSTLMASEVSGRKNVLEWNVVCSGENETVFFEY